MKRIIYLSFLILLTCSLSYAKEAKNSKKLPQKGVLLSSFNSPNNLKMYDTWGGDSLDGASSAPINAKITKNSATVWDLTASNNSKDKYVFTLEFLQFSDDGKQIKKNVFPFSLMPNASKTVKVVPSDRGDDFVVNIISWKKYDLNKEKKKEANKAKHDIEKEKVTKDIKKAKSKKSNKKKD